MNGWPWDEVCVGWPVVVFLGVFLEGPASLMY